MRKIGVGTALIGPSPAILAAAFLTGSEPLPSWFVEVTFLFLWVWNLNPGRHVDAAAQAMRPA
jgi:hypothetical protein